MRILLVGDANSRFVRDYAEHLLKHLPAGSEVDLYATMTPAPAASLKIFHHVYSYPHLRLYARFKKLRVLIRFVFFLSFIYCNQRRYSFIHFHYIYIDYFVLGFLPFLPFPKIIVTIYGSDYNKMPENKRKLLSRFYERAEKITFANLITSEAFNAYYRLNSNKLRLCRFGLAPLEILRAFTLGNRSESRKILDLPQGKNIIAVGYNFNKDQQHLKVLESIANSTKVMELKNEILLIFPLTYGFDPAYKANLIERIKALPYEYRIFENYLPEQENAMLIHSCDVLIQLQKNDQFSGAMQEHLYCGNVVITGDWLPYGPFKQQGVYFKEIHAIDEVSDELFSVLQGLREEKLRSSVNREIIYQMSSWNNTIYNWMELYK